MFPVRTSAGRNEIRKRKAAIVLSLPFPLALAPGVFSFGGVHVDFFPFGDEERDHHFQSRFEFRGLPGGIGGAANGRVDQAAVSAPVAANETIHELQRRIATSGPAGAAGRYQSRAVAQSRFSTPNPSRPPAPINGTPPAP